MKYIRMVSKLTNLGLASCAIISILHGIQFYTWWLLIEVVVCWMLCIYIAFRKHKRKEAIQKHISEIRSRMPNQQPPNTL